MVRVIYSCVSVKCFQAGVIVLVSHQMNTSYETYIKMQSISNLMEETYFYLRPLVLSIGAFILVISCNFASIRMYETVDVLIYFGFAGTLFFILMLIVYVFPLADTIYENSVAFKFNMQLITRRHK